MRIWLITVGEPLPLPGSNGRPWRTGMLAQLLARRGHEVIWWTSTVDHFTKRYFVDREDAVRVSAGLTLRFLHGRLYRKNVSLARFVNHLQIARRFRSLARSEPAPDVILSSYPTIELCDEAVRYAARSRIPVLLDIRDLWPDELALRLPPAIRWLAPLIFFPLYRRAKRAISGATGIVAISQTYLRWARNFTGRRTSAADLWAPIGYLPAPASTEVSPHVAQRIRDAGVSDARRIIWFCGTFVGSIDLSCPIEAARLMKEDSRFQFVFTGSGERDAEWRTQAAGLGNVVFTGWAGPEDLRHLASRAWVGLAAYKRGALMSLPNKLFEYMSAGLPILSSLTGEAQELIESHHVGVSYRAGDARDLASRIQELSMDEDACRSMSSSARRLFGAQFDATRVYDQLVAHLESCCSAPAAQELKAVSTSP